MGSHSAIHLGSGTMESDPKPTKPYRETSAFSPSLVLLNGKIFCAEPTRRYAEAVAISGERIVAVGTTTEIAALADADTRQIDLAGRLVIPGINDAHFHHTPDPRAIILPVTSMEPTWDDILDAVAAAVKEAPKGTWILGTH